jgi:exopolysaccharide biosynthesis protein
VRSHWQIFFVGFIILLLSSIALSFQQSFTPAKLKSSPTLTITSPGDWRSIQNGVEFRKISLGRSEPNHSIDFKVLRFDTRWVTPRILRSNQFQLKGANVKILAEKSGAIAAINANYFDEKGQPLGFLKINAQEINSTVSKSSLISGIFGVRSFSPFIIHRDEFQSLQADEALQCGPLLLKHGSPLEVTRGVGRYSRRSVIGIDQEKRLLVAVTDGIFGGLSWAELQELFSASQWQLQARDLLNLDGGGSAQLYVRTANLEEMIAGTSEIPVAIGFFTKPD